MGKEANLLMFDVSLETLNTLLECLKHQAWVVPVDLEVFKIGEYPGALSGYYLMMSSENFPLVKEGEQVKPGEIEFVRGVHRTTVTFRGVKHE